MPFQLDTPFFHSALVFFSGFSYIYLDLDCACEASQFVLLSVRSLSLNFYFAK